MNLEISAPARTHEDRRATSLLRGYSPDSRAQIEEAPAHFAEQSARFEAEKLLDAWSGEQHERNRQIAESRLIRLFPSVFSDFGLDFDSWAASMVVDRR